MENKERVLKMKKLYPFEALEADYYMGDEATGGVARDSEEELSSDDELQQELCKLAGIKRDCVQKRRQEKPTRSEFEMDMEYELDQLITDYANEHLSGNVKKEKVQAVSAKEFVEQCQEDEMPALVGGSDDEDEEEQAEEGENQNEVPSKRLKMDESVKTPKSIKAETMEVENIHSDAKPSSSLAGVNHTADASAENEETSKNKEQPKKHVTWDEAVKEENEEEETNPIKKAAKQSIKDTKKQIPEYYDPEEDDENEKWMQRQRKKATGLGDPKKAQEARPSIDGNSDAVLSCPGCMVMLTRDCQRHEIYNGQYRAMFVENCRVEHESLKIEKTGKERRRERQRLKKMGLDPNEQPVAEDDLFLPVHCAVCSTNVAVMDHDEVYHFFNVLSGYA
ncbi:unnamed protein product [Cylicocyclus nassatus]|uniref:E2F-associated phosphoprotein n=1 Tax=Cylicocyclus nassatus TaxID=53992 RepID=A0AA36M5V9_CYLNA|nr:unnamed protein product [Cylicocyclus nassatus]